MMENVTYIFAKGRKNNFENNLIQARDFYYGLTSFEKEKFNINIIELNAQKGLLNNLLKLLDKILQRVFSLPFYSSHLTNLKNYKILRKSQQIIMVNESVACSAFLMLPFLKLFTDVKISVFVMGLYSKKLKYPLFKKIHQLLIRIVIRYIDNIFFLGIGELEIARTIHKNDSKLIFFPFSIDTEFWSDRSKVSSGNKNDIIFVGNDGSRDVKLLTNLAEKLNNYNFIFVSNIQHLQNINIKNVELYSGKWGDGRITDMELKSLYLNSKLSIIPLKETSQPSGQSVALQSMSLGIPVLISRTKGFWDPETILENKDIFFIGESSVDAWKKKIEQIFEDKKLYESVQENAKMKVKENYSIEKFHHRLHSYL